MPSDDPKGKDSPAIMWAKYSQLAFVLPAAVVVGLLLGRLFDYWFNTKWLYMAGIIVGAIAGFVDIIRTVMKDKG